jgi:hypothetical protein
VKYEENVWYGWNGGECPVHPKSELNVVFDDLSGWVGNRTVRADSVEWLGSCEPCAFRVVRAHREPREFWITTFDGVAWDTPEQAERHNRGAGEIIHVIEKLP